MSTPFDRDPQRAIEAAVEAAELKRSKGDICGAYADYQAILAQRIGAEYIAADLSVIQSLADLAVLCGNFQAADDLLVGLMADSPGDRSGETAAGKATLCSDGSPHWRDSSHRDYTARAAALGKRLSLAKY
jgi:hypothetical protein